MHFGKFSISQKNPTDFTFQLTQFNPMHKQEHDETVLMCCLDIVCHICTNRKITVYGFIKLFFRYLNNYKIFPLLKVSIKDQMLCFYGINSTLKGKGALNKGVIMWSYLVWTCWGDKDELKMADVDWSAIPILVFISLPFLSLLSKLFFTKEPPELFTLEVICILSSSKTFCIPQQFTTWQGGQHISCQRSLM